MIKDHELLKNPDLLFSKRFILWGAGKEGKALAEKMLKLTKKMELVDADETKTGIWKYGISVFAPSIISERDQKEIAIILTPDDISLQDSILLQIASMGYQNIDVYTKFAVEAILCFKKDEVIPIEGEEQICVLSQKMEMQERAISRIENRLKLMERMLLIGASDKSAYVYQSKKVASVTIVNSIRLAGGYGFHVHSFRGLFLERITVRNFIRKTSGKVISIVREPIARQISLLWHYWGTNREAFLNDYKSLEDLESKFYAIPNREDEFEWYRQEIEQVLDINIYDYPFDRELGYSIIEKDGILLLLLKMEKLGSLEKVIGDFLGIKGFKLINANVADEKKYRYAYKNYLENVKIPLEFFEHYYNGNLYMDHFYTEEEKKEFHEYWREHLGN